ncbi:MAG: pilus assembly protein [Rhodospirillales bacterium]|nr:pilus assembly protein [Rhodospirillales bacterium]
MKTTMPKAVSKTLALLRRLGAERGGVAAVEFAAGATVLFGLTMGIMDLGRAMHTLNSVENAAKTGARYASIHGLQSSDPKTDGEISTFIMSQAVGIDTTYMTPLVTWEDPANQTPGTSVTVNVSQQFNFFYGAIFSTDPFNLTAQSTYTITR